MLPLLLTYFCYLLLGATVFQLLEKPAEAQSREQFQMEKLRFLENYTCLDRWALERFLQVRGAGGQPHAGMWGQGLREGPGLWAEDLQEQSVVGTEPGQTQPWVLPRSATGSLRDLELVPEPRWTQVCSPAR